MGQGKWGQRWGEKERERGEICQPMKAISVGKTHSRMPVENKNLEFSNLCTAHLDKNASYSILTINLLQ